MKDSNYHRMLRIAMLVCAVLLIFQSGVVSKASAKMSMTTQQYLANAIGMSASIEPTELNQITAELTTQKRALESRETALREREIAVELASRSGSSANTTYVLAGILFVLLLLIIFNYVLDYLRYQKRVASQVTKTV